MWQACIIGRYLPLHQMSALRLALHLP